MICDIDRLLAVFEAYCAAVQLAPATVSARLLGRGGRIAELRAGGDMGARTIRDLLVKFSQNWPEGAEWPADVERPPVQANSSEPVEGCAA